MPHRSVVGAEIRRRTKLDRGVGYHGRAMPKHTLFAYVEGYDLEGVAEAVETRLDALVADRTWELADVWVVNQRHPPDAGAKPGDLPAWDLGLNLTLPAGKKRSSKWTNDVVAIATAFASLHRETGRNFVIGVHDGKSDDTKDLFQVDTASPDLDRLRTALETVKA